MTNVAQRLELLGERFRVDRHNAKVWERVWWPVLLVGRARDQVYSRVSDLRIHGVSHKMSQ